jgi:hypothetical protein
LWSLTVLPELKEKPGAMLAGDFFRRPRPLLALAADETTGTASGFEIPQNKIASAA